jgi:microcystin-dependent protein
MPSTFTTNTGIEKPDDGEQAGLWGNTVNLNSDILDRALNGVGFISLTTSTYTLTTSSGTLSDGQYDTVFFTGTPGVTVTVTVAPATAQKTYAILNGTNQSIVITQGSGSNVTLQAGAGGIVACNGGGATASVYEITALMNTATSANTANAVVRRDGSGNFVAGTVIGNVTGNLTGDVTTSSITLGGTAVTATAAELNILDGVTATAAELNILDGVTATAAELNILDGVTATAAELNILDGVTATAAELNILDGVTATAAELNTLDGINTAGNFGLFPSGGIIMWSGSIASIPAGWFLCDGSNGTPNLRDRFVVGAGSTYAVGVTGGAAVVSLAEAMLPSHAHYVNLNTTTTGAHSHTIDLYGAASDVSGQQPAGEQPDVFLYTQTTGTAGSHFHNVQGNTLTTGSGSAHENRPPYWALAYIMKA